MVLRYLTIILILEAFLGQVKPTDVYRVSASHKERDMICSGLAESFQDVSFCTKYCPVFCKQFKCLFNRCYFIMCMCRPLFSFEYMNDNNQIMVQ